MVEIKHRNPVAVFDAQIGCMGTIVKALREINDDCRHGISGILWRELLFGWGHGIMSFGKT